MTSHNFSLRFPFARRTNENANTSQLASKAMTKTSTTAQPKRALGDITNLSRPGQPAPTNLKTANIPFETSSKVAEPIPSISAPPKRPRPATPLDLNSRSDGPAVQGTAATKSPSITFISTSTVAGSVDRLFETVRLPEGVMDIDDADAGEYLANASYAKDVYQNFLRVEQKYIVDPEYMSRQPELTTKMRSILVDWIVDVHRRFDLLPDTLHLAIHLFDRFLEYTKVSKRQLQLVGVTALFIASKYEEMYVPAVDDFVAITNRSYSIEDIYHMESVILNRLKFDVTVPSALTFLHRVVKAIREEIGFETKQLENAAQFLIELALQDYVMLRYRTSLRASAATMLAGKVLGIPIAWSQSMKFHSGGWTVDDMEECEAELRRILNHERSVEGKNKLTALRRKFDGERYDKISSSMCEEL